MAVVGDPAGERKVGETFIALSVEQSLRVPKVKLCQAAIRRRPQLSAKMIGTSAPEEEVSSDRLSRSEKQTTRSAKARLAKSTHLRLQIGSGQEAKEGSPQPVSQAEGCAVATIEHRALGAQDGEARPYKSWEDLMAAAQAGETKPYQRLLAELKRSLLRYYARRLPQALINDTIQEVLLAMHLARETYAPDLPFRPWIFTIARYKWIDQLRALSRTSCEELEEDHAQAPDHGDAVVSAIVVNKLLEQLKPAQAAVIRLVKLQGYSISDAAKATGQSPSLVKVNIHRGLCRLKCVAGSGSDRLGREIECFSGRN